MVGVQSLRATADKLVARLNEGGVATLDEVLYSTRKTAATYRYTYDRYVQYFRDAGEILTDQDLFVGFAMAYTWMATIKQLDPRIQTTESAVATLNRLRSLKPEQLGEEPEQVADLDGVIQPVRDFVGSVIGTSKLLHFANPDVFPIWDAVVNRYCYPVEPKNADSLNRYVAYTYNIHALVNDKNFESQIYLPVCESMERAHSEVADQYDIPNRMGKVRTAEFVMFFGGKVAQPDEYRERRWGEHPRSR